MKIVRPYAKLMDPQTLTAATRHIEYCARISHRSEEESAANTERFLRAVVLQHGDWSVVEHVTASVEMLVDRGITHEIVRHRIASYTQESTRFVNYAKKMPPSFIYPKPEVECAHCLSGQPVRLEQGRWVHSYHGASAEQECSYDPAWLRTIDFTETGYRILLEQGWRPQEARSVFPNALAAKIVVTMNLRSWRHFFLMRTSKEAHPQMRQVTIPLLADFKLHVPVLFEDIEPEARQVENIAKGR